MQKTCQNFKKHAHVFGKRHKNMGIEVAKNVPCGCHLASTSLPQGQKVPRGIFCPAPWWRVIRRGPAKFWRGGAKILRDPAKCWRGMSSQHNFTTLITHCPVYFDITFDVLVFHETLAAMLLCFVQRSCKQYCFCAHILIATIPVVLDIFQNIATFDRMLHMPISMFIMILYVTSACRT